MAARTRGLQRGWAEYNVIARHCHECMTKRAESKPLQHPKALDKTPIFMDHSLLHDINQRSELLGHGSVFPECKVPPASNNNEKFLKPYCLDQVERNRKGYTNRDTKQCTCHLCTESIADVPQVQEDQCEVIALPPHGEINEDDPRPQLTSPNGSSDKDEPPAYLSHPKFKKCFDFEPYLCEEMLDYWKKRIDREKMLGRPPHSYNCSKHSMFNGVAPEN